MIFTPISDTSCRRAAWLICSLAFMALAAVACEIEADLPPRVAVAPTATPNPAETPAPAESPTPPSALTQEPAGTPESASEPTPAPTQEPAGTPELTSEPATTPTPAPTQNPTATPESISEPTPHPEPTPAPEPAPHREYTLAPAGSTVVTDNGIALTITSFTPDAESILANENPDYEPLEGYRPLIARLRVQNVGGNANNPIPMEFAIGYLRLIDSSSVTLGGMADTVEYRHSSRRSRC